MKKLIILTLFCVSCSDRLNNTQIINEVQECTKAGLTAEFVRDLSGVIQDVQCGPREAR